MARLHTSMDSSPDELHAMGREIVDEVRQEIIETGSRLFGTTDIAQIFDRLSNDPSLRYRAARRCWSTPGASWPPPKRRRPVVRHRPRRALHGRARARGGGGRHGEPPTTCRARSTARARGRTTSTRPSREERHRYVAEDIAFHEAVPGHHFQLTIAMESKDLAPARQVLHDTACAEGWGLYSERLADEMGLYTDDLARMGLFAADSWRASRLVVDTGLHAMGWTRQQAVDWMADHTPLPRIEIETEIDRYISFPGQALAYMVGRREIVRLRAVAAERSGRASTSGSSTTWCCGPGSSPCRPWPAPSSAGSSASAVAARPAAPVGPALPLLLEGRVLVADGVVDHVHPLAGRPAADLGPGRHLELERDQHGRLQIGQRELQRR